MIKVNHQILCLYANFTNQIQITRIINIPDFYFERIVFPGERFLFEVEPDAELEVYTNTKGNTILLEKISCDRLHVNEGMNSVELQSIG